ncbi:MAG: FG-GAP repeat domain-containing protein, partial [Thermoguttaceae bacterium]
MTPWKIAARLAGCLAMLLAPRLPDAVGAAEDCTIRLADATQASAIAFRHTDGSTGRRYIVETVTAGIATFDYDGDGLVDIYFVNGGPTPESKFDKPPRNALYRNLGNFRFVDVTDQAGVGDTGYGLGATAADCDNDGDQDLYVSNFGPNVLYRNNGDGTFADVTDHAGVGRGTKVGAGVCFLDADADGQLDLYAANYVRFTYATHVETVVDGHPQYTGPKDYEPETHDFFFGRGDGTFRDAGKESGIADHPSTGMGVVTLDYDNDADTDIAVLNDVRGNFLFENDGHAHFQEIGLAAGFAYSADGMELGSMGIDCADYNNDGWLDLYQTSYAAELPALFKNTGAGFFEDVSRAAGAGARSFSAVNWGP